jgi:hypothetical protein
MPQVISETLDQIKDLHSPVVRSCHIGNNTSNIWGWLALGGNTRLVEYDHTIYGLDENCASWVVLNDGGRIQRCYSPSGEELTDERQSHLNEHLKRIDKKYSSHLNYGIFALHENEDLIIFHNTINKELCRQINNSKLSFDSSEIAGSQELLSNLIKDLHKARKLDLIFNRWVQKSRKDQVLMHKVQQFEYRENDTIIVHSSNNQLLFEGNLDALLHTFFEGMRTVSNRLHTGEKLENVNYPWITLQFSYLLATVHEYHADKSQRTFWHAAGSASQYYINETAFQELTAQLVDFLISHGYLPEGVHLTMIPTYCCQLFATQKNSLAILEKIIVLWMNYIKEDHDLKEDYTALLSTVTNPYESTIGFYKKMDNRVKKELEQMLDEFNEIDENRLPVAHIANINHPTYNKYGIAQANLLGKEIFIPALLKEMTWAEAELLIKVFSFMKMEESG